MKNTNKSTTTLRSLLVVATLISAMITIGCTNTMRGVGEDTERVGESIQDASR